MPCVDPETLLDYVVRDHHLFRAADTRPRVLAPLLSHILSQPTYYQSAKTALQSRLLRLTADHASRHCEYFTTKLPQCGTELTDDAWVDYPTLDRASAESHREQLIASNTRFAFMSFTSGTTGSAPLLIERSIEEQEYLRDIVSLILLPVRACRRDAPLGIALLRSAHGAGLQFPDRGYSFLVDMEREEGFRRVQWLLRKQFALPGYEPFVSRISGNICRLYQLFHFLSEQGFEPYADQLQAVIGCGMPLPSHRRRAMEAYFSTRVKDVYSMAEVFGPAEYCHDCDAHHFLPYVVDEVLPIGGSGAPIESGTGEMTLTPLFPFTQRFVLLRYRTGDLVHVESVECRRGSKAYRFRGRLKYAVCLDSSDNLYICNAEVAKALDGIGELHRERTAPRVLSSPGVGEWPRFMLSHGSHREGVHISVEADAEFRRTGDDGWLAKRVGDAVLKIVPTAVGDWLVADPARLEITIHDPDSLPETVQQYL